VKGGLDCKGKERERGEEQVNHYERNLQERKKRLIRNERGERNRSDFGFLDVDEREE